MSVRLAVFASGAGTNLQALIDRFHRAKNSPVRVTLVLSDHADSGALQRARAAGIDAAHIAYAARHPDYIAHEMLAALESADIDMIALAGYLRLVPAAVVRRFTRRMINIHPALLPAFGGKGMFGKRVHEAVIASGAAVSGATVHYVDERYDEGRIIAQWPMPVRPDDDPKSLAARILTVEHMLFPAAVELVARALERGDTAPVAARIAGNFLTTSDNAPAEAELRRALGVE